MHGMTLVSFEQFRKNLGNLQEFFGQMVHRPPPPPPWQKIARTPMHRRHVIFLFVSQEIEHAVRSNYVISQVALMSSTQMEKVERNLSKSTVT